MRPSQRLAQDRMAVVEFKLGLLQYAKTMHYFGDNAGSWGSWQPKAGQEEESAGLRADVNLLSGPAARVSDETGIRLLYKPPGQIGGHMRLNPIAGWASAFAEISAMTVGLQDVLDHTDRIIGTLDGEIAKAEARERTIIGRLARFLSFPRGLREEMGLAAGSVGGRAVQTAGVFVQLFIGLLVAVVGGLIVLALGKALGL